MIDWQTELDCFLAEYEAVFSRREVRRQFRHYVRTLLPQRRVSLFKHILLHDGTVSVIYRLASIAIFTAIIALCMSAKTLGMGLMSLYLLTICSGLIWAPGFWMWYYTFMSEEERIRRMLYMVGEDVNRHQPSVHS